MTDATANAHDIEAIKGKFEAHPFRIHQIASCEFHYLGGAQCGGNGHG
jgi:hypothetical protein